MQVELLHFAFELLLIFCTSVCSLAVWQIKRQIDKNEKKKEEFIKSQQNLVDSINSINMRLQQVETEYRAIKEANKRYDGQINSIVEDLKIVKDSQLAQTRDRLLQAFRFFIAQEKAPALARENIEMLMQSYEKMGGNGFIHSLYEQFKALPLDQQNMC